MKLEVLNIEGKGTGRKVDLSKDIFGIEPNEHAVYLDVKQFLANQRQGTHKTKERGEIKASTRKLIKQKGTGGARKGSISNPIFIGGGRIFGPRPRDYSFKLNQKVKELARKSALSVKASAEGIVVLEDFKLKKPRTQDFKHIMTNLGLADKKVLLVINDNDKNIILSGRNLPKASITTAASLNTYDIMNAQYLVISESSFQTITSILGN